MKQWILVLLLLPLLVSGQNDFLWQEIPRTLSQKQQQHEQALLSTLAHLESEGKLSLSLLQHYNKLSIFYLKNGYNYQAAALYNERVFASSDLEHLPKLKAASLNIKARILHAQGLFSAAIEALMPAIELEKETKDSLQLALSYQYLASNLRLQRQYEAALNYLLQAEQIRSQLNRPNPKMFQLIGTIYLYVEDYNNARHYLEKALHLAEKRKQKNLIALSLIELADLDYQEGRYDASLERLETIVNISEYIPSSARQVGAWRILARNYLQLGKVKLAKQYSEKALAAAQGKGIINWQIFILNEVIAANKKLDLHKETIDALELQRTLKDSMFKLENLRLANDYQTLYETHEKEKQLFEQQEIIAQQRAARNRMLFTFGLCAILGLGGFLFYRNNVQHQRELAAKNAELQGQKIQELEQQQKILAMRAMIEGQEAERMRIAKDLHDGIGGLLTAVKAHFTAIETELEKIRNFKLYEKTNALIDEACVEVRRISHNMLPHTLLLSGLGGALEGIASQLEAQGTQCDLDINEELKNLGETKTVMIYRIIQELVNNIQKHAEASNVLLQVLAFPDFIQILVEDDGKGFDTENPQTQKGLGLKSIASRVNYLNGTLQYDSVLGTGTTVSIEIPSS